MNIYIVVAVGTDDHGVSDAVIASSKKGAIKEAGFEDYHVDECYKLSDELLINYLKDKKAI